MKKKEKLMKEIMDYLWSDEAYEQHRQIKKILEIEHKLNPLGLIEVKWNKDETTQ